MLEQKGTDLVKTKETLQNDLNFLSLEKANKKMKKQNYKEQLDVQLEQNKKYKEDHMMNAHELNVNICDL